MSNKKVVERFEQAQGAKIEKLFWIAGSLEHCDLKDLIEEMSDEAFENCFPEVFNSPYFEEYRDEGELLQALVDKDKLGLVAEILIPIAKNFSYDQDGNVSSWSSSSGYCQVDYVYGDTLELLLVEVEKSADKHFKYFLENDKNK
jgi:hypothetical protein